MQHKKAFTLIELLVVISIIALLSSVVLASLNSARDKASIAAGRQFAMNLDHAAGDYAVGIWDFDDCSGSLAADRSGYGNNAVLTGSPTWSTDTYSGRGCSLSLNASSQYGSVANLSAGIANATSYSVAGWVKPQNAPVNHQFYFGFRNDANIDFYVLQLIGSNNLECRFRNSAGTWADASPAPVITPGKWQHIALTYNGSKSTCYINGVPKGTAAVSGTVTNTGVTFNIGSYGGGFPYGGLMDEVRLYAKELTASDVMKLYAEERQKYLSDEVK